MLRELYAILFKQHNSKDAEGAKYSLLGAKGSALFLDYSLSCFRGLVYVSMCKCNPNYFRTESTFF